MCQYNPTSAEEIYLIVSRLEVTNIVIPWRIATPVAKKDDVHIGKTIVTTFLFHHCDVGIIGPSNSYWRYYGTIVPALAIA